MLLVYVQMWLRWTLPRIRIDQVLHMCVKVLLPLAVLNLLGAAIYLWLTDPHLANGGVSTELEDFALIMQIALASLGVLLILALAALVAWAWATRPTSTYKVIFENKTDIRSLPGA